MTPITRSEQYLAYAAGDTDDLNSLPEPITREDYYLKRICLRLAAILSDIANISVSAEDIQTAVNAYLGENGGEVGRAATMAEFLEVLNNG